jgi:hypothetical protein
VLYRRGCDVQPLDIMAKPTLTERQRDVFQAELWRWTEHEKASQESIVDAIRKVSDPTMKPFKQQTISQAMNLRKFGLALATGIAKARNFVSVDAIVADRLAGGQVDALLAELKERRARPKDAVIERVYLSPKEAYVFELVAPLRVAERTTFSDHDVYWYLKTYAANGFEGNDANVWRTMKEKIAARDGAVSKLPTPDVGEPDVPTKAPPKTKKASTR